MSTCNNLLHFDICPLAIINYISISINFQQSITVQYLSTFNNLLHFNIYLLLAIIYYISTSIYYQISTTFQHLSTINNLLLLTSIYYLQ